MILGFWIAPHLVGKYIIPGSKSLPQYQRVADQLYYLYFWILNIYPNLDLSFRQTDSKRRVPAFTHHEPPQKWTCPPPKRRNDLKTKFNLPTIDFQGLYVTFRGELIKKPPKKGGRKHRKPPWSLTPKKAVRFFVFGKGTWTVPTKPSGFAVHSLGLYIWNGNLRYPPQGYLPQEVRP